MYRFFQSETFRINNVIIPYFLCTRRVTHIMFSTNTIAKLAGINNFVLNEATTIPKYSDEQILDLIKKVELGIRQNDELFKLNKKLFGGADKTTEETAEEEQKKQEERDKAHDEANKETAARDEKMLPKVMKN